MKPQTKKYFLIAAIVSAVFMCWHFIFRTPRWEIYREDGWSKLCSQGVREIEAGNIDRADDFFEQASNLITNARPTDIRRGTTLQDLAWVQKQRHHFERAAELYEQSLPILIANGPPALCQKAIVLNDLATVQAALGRYQNATICLEESISINETENGYNSPELATNLHNYAGVLLLLGRTSEALKAAQRATDIDHGNGERWRHKTTVPSS